MKIFAAIAVLFVGLLALASCASLTKEECLASNWQIIGQRDGVEGHDPKRQFRRHVNACKKVGTTPDHPLWNQGFQQGLTRYCTPLRGLVVGQQGRAYNHVCPAASERGFLRGYLLGKAENSLKSRISSLEIQSADLESDVSSLLGDIGTATPTVALVLTDSINQKRDELDLARLEKENVIYDLSRVEHLIEQFLQNLNLNYDPARL